MIIRYLHVRRALRAVRPFKANPPLIIDSDAVLTLPIPFYLFKAVARQRREIFNRGCSLQPIQL
jgi:hypothetical protein